METPLALTLPKTARALQISEAAARKLAAAGALPVVKLGPRLTRVPLEALRAQLAAQAGSADGEG